MDQREGEPPRPRPLPPADPGPSSRRPRRRTGFLTPALPFCRVTLQAPRPHPPWYPNQLRTAGDHVRRKRTGMGMLFTASENCTDLAKSTGLLPAIHGAGPSTLQETGDRGHAPATEDVLQHRLVEPHGASRTFLVSDTIETFLSRSCHDPHNWCMNAHPAPYIFGTSHGSGSRFLTRCRRYTANFLWESFSSRSA